MTTEKLAFYLRAALEWIDAVPKDVADRLPAMPGFSRDEADAALVGMPSGKMAPVQGYPRGIPWEMHLQAYDVYCKRYRPQQALITGGCRGGFGTGELDDFIPGWREKLSERTALVNQIQDLQAKLAAARDDARGNSIAAEHGRQLVKTLEPAWDYVQKNPGQFDANLGDDKTPIIVGHFLRWATMQRPAFVTFDDGSHVFVDSWTGGNHDTGYFGGITLRFVAADGTATVRGYQALDTIKGTLAPDSDWVKTIRHEVMFQSKSTHNFTFSRDEVIELLGGKFMAMDTAARDAKTPAAQWREKGDPDPHAGHYDGERSTLALGTLTDDELANGVFMNADQPLNIERVLARDPEYHPPIVWLTAAKERIRWLSRSLVKATSQSQRLGALRALCGYVENGTDSVVTVFQDDATREWVMKVGKKGYYGPTLSDAFDAAVAGEKPSA